MQGISITVNFTSAAAAIAALQLLGNPPAEVQVISPLDNPALGAPSTAGVVQSQTAPTTSTPLPFPGVPAPAPTPAPVGSAAPASGAAPSTPASNGTPELDSRGLPWDERIHAGTKGKNKDLTWKARKNVDDALRVAIEAELRAKVSAATGTYSAAAPVVTNDAAAAFATQLQAQAQAQTAEQAAMAEMQAALALATKPAEPLTGTGKPLPKTFVDLLVQTSAAMTAGRLPVATLTPILGKYGIQAIGQMSDPALHVHIPALAAELAQYL